MTRQPHKAAVSNSPPSGTSERRETGARIIPISRGATNACSDSSGGQEARKPVNLFGQQAADLFARLRAEPVKPPLIDRIADALGSRDFLFLYAGFWLGCMATVCAAAVIVRLS
jgi:hypothetical protein